MAEEELGVAGDRGQDGLVGPVDNCPRLAPKELRRLRVARVDDVLAGAKCGLTQALEHWTASARVASAWAPQVRQMKAYLAMR